MSFGTRLNKIILLKYKNIRDFVETVGMSRTLVDSYIKDKTNPSIKKVQEFADILDISPAWLAYGIGEKQTDIKISTEDDLEVIEIINLIHIKIEDWLKVKKRDMDSKTKAKLAKLIYQKLKIDGIIDVSKIDDFIEILNAA